MSEDKYQTVLVPSRVPKGEYCSGPRLTDAICPYLSARGQCLLVGGVPTISGDYIKKSEECIKLEVKNAGD